MIYYCAETIVYPFHSKYGEHTLGKGWQHMRKRKDPTGKVLRDREGYILNEEGKVVRYRYRYIDQFTGQQKCIYGKTLEELRERVRKMEQATERGILREAEGHKMTLNQAFAEYLKTKQLAESTLSNYKSIWRERIADGLGMRIVGKIRASEIKSFYAQLSKDGYSHNTIKIIHAMINPTMNMLFEDGILPNNPAKTAIKKYGYKAEEKEALTQKEQQEFLRYVQSSAVYRNYYNMFVLALGTGLRVGELIGLRWKDIDLDQKIISVDHQLIYKNYGDGYRLHISEHPKSEAGTRKIPMTDNVYKALTAIRKQSFDMGMKSIVEIDGYRDFLFVTKNGRPIMPNAYNNILYNIVHAYNKEAKKNKLKLLPEISSHTLRHTACTRMAEKKMDPKVLQYIMGHSSITITMEVYNHIAEMQRVEAEIQRLDLEVADEKKMDKYRIIA